MTVTGTCNFCGQTQMVDLPDTTPEHLIESEANRLTSLECHCKEGSDWRASMLVIEKCADNIEMMFRDSYPDVADLLQEGKGIVYSGAVKKITCVTPEGGSASIYKRGGSIEVKFTQKKETVMSADW